jgi:hypothetical protein
MSTKIGRRLAIPCGVNGVWRRLTRGAPLSVSGHESYIDPSNDSLIDNPGGAITYAKDGSQTIVDPVTDGDMEAVGVAAWPKIVSSETVTKESVDPYAGTQNLKTVLGAATGGVIQTGILNVGERTLVQLARRHSGGATGTFSVHNNSFAGLPASWTLEKFILTPVAVNFACWISAGGTIGDDWEMDAVEVSPGSHAFQGTAGNRPTHNQTTDTIDCVAASSQYLDWIVPNAAAGTLWMWVKPTALAANMIPCGSLDAAGAYTYFQYNHGLGTWGFGIGATAFTNTNVTATTNWTFLALTWDGASEACYVDAAAINNSNGDSASTRALLIGAHDGNGVLSQYWDGSIGEVGLMTRAATATEIAAIRAGTMRA